MRKSTKTPTRAQQEARASAEKRAMIRLTVISGAVFSGLAVLFAVAFVAPTAINANLAGTTKITAGPLRMAINRPASPSAQPPAKSTPKIVGIEIEDSFHSNYTNITTSGYDVGVSVKNSYEDTLRNVEARR